LSWTSPANTRIDTKVVADSALSSIDFNALNGSDYYEYNLSLNLKNNTSEGAKYALVINNDETPANYYIQYEDINGSTTNTGNINDNYILSLDAGQTGFAKLTISKDINSYIRAILQGSRGIGVDIHNLNQTITTVNTFPNIESLGIKSIK